MTPVALLVLAAAVLCAPASRDFTFVDYDRFMAKLDRLRASALNLHIFKVYDGFERYQVSPRPACGRAQKFPCKNPVVEIANFQRGPQFVSTLPTLLLVGGFHGDEVVGTNALYYLIELFEKNYQRDPAFANLLDNVRLLLLPMANVNGFYYQTREETTDDGRSTDPNRDFPFNLLSGQKCFKTSTALLLDAIFRKNLVVGCLTFHGGDNSITFPWGAPAHQAQPNSPDHVAFKSVAEMLRRAGANNPSMGVQTYDVGTMHQVVYDVRGGFEDWAYAASGDRGNVNADCALHENPQFDLFREKISYDQTSNRALVFLVEAGYNKTPDELFLGSDQPLTSPEPDLGKWGHVTRNINIALRLAETMRPHAVLTKLSYGDALQAEVSVRGCIQIDEILQEQTPMTVLRQEKHELTNEWRLFLEFRIPPGTTRSLTFSVVCDRAFARPTGGNAPITHFVRLRTTKDYFLNYQGNRLRSKNVVQVTVLNVRTDLLGNAVIQWNPGNINALTYSNTLRGVQNARARQSDQVVHLSFAQGSLHVQTLATAGNARQKELGVRKFGAMGEKWAQASPRHLVSLKSGGDAQMSSQAFLSLVGKDVDVSHEHSAQVLYTQTLVPDAVNSYEEEMNALFVPPSGVNCRSDESRAPFYFVEATRSREGDLRVALHTDREEFYSFKLGELRHDLELTSASKFEGRWLSKYQSKLTVREPDDLRILARSFELIANKKTKVFTCLLVYRDDQVGAPIQPEAVDQTVWVWSAERNERRNNALILILFAAFMAAAIYYGVRLRQSSFSEKSEKDLQVIIHSASSFSRQENNG